MQKANTILQGTELGKWGQCGQSYCSHACLVATRHLSSYPPWKILLNVSCSSWALLLFWIMTWSWWESHTQENMYSFIGQRPLSVSQEKYLNDFKSIVAHPVLCYVCWVLDGASTKHSSKLHSVTEENRFDAMRSKAFPWCWATGESTEPSRKLHRKHPPQH